MHTAPSEPAIFSALEASPSAARHGRASALRTSIIRAMLPNLRRADLVRTVLMVAVAIPTVAVALYYAFWASDVYVSESRFVVRSPERPAAASLGSLLQGVGFSKAQDESDT